MSEPLDPYAVDAPVLDGIAIVGMAGRFPGARNLDEFWRNLRAGVESVSFFSVDELIAAGVPRALVERPEFVRAKATLEDAAAFDAAFFGYLPAEAEMTDPQQRIFLECAWAALEDAGYDPAAAPGLVGIFGGMSQSAYLALVKQVDPAGAKYSGYPLRLGTDKDYLTTRVSYKLNLRGPSMSVQTACSTSLVAVCQACQSLLSYQCDTALAGGVSVTLPPKSGHLHQEGGIHSADGHCRPFDHGSSGIVEGEGVGIVVLKRLADALADGDTVHAVIKGFGLGNDGSGKVGFTAPSPDGQAEAIGAALALAGVSPETISYIEAHGTGTPLGDPIEIAGLTKAFRAAGAERDQFCAIGSVKSNIGHLDTAAGIAGLIKTVLALRHRELPPSLHFTQPNPAIDFARSPFIVNHTLHAWRTDGVPRRAGVSSFGLGGTNAHVVIEEAPLPAHARAHGGHDTHGASGGTVSAGAVSAGTASPQGQAAFLLPLSARTSAALDAATAQLAEAFATRPDLSLADAAFTLQRGRHAFNERRVVVAADTTEARDVLSGSQPRRLISGTATAGTQPVVFLFPGQGAQQVDMGREIYEREPVFRDAVDRSAELLLPHLGCDLRGVLYPAADREGARNALTQTWLTQPALFVIEHALATQLMAWGIVPEAMLGHSVGEYVAACLSGVLTLEDALHLLAARARLMQDLPAGSMLAVRLAEFELQPWLGAQVSLAAVNGPTACVVSGPTPEITALEATLTARGVACRRLATSHAFHSGMMDPIASRFTEVVKGIRRGRPSIPYLSNVTSHWITEADVAEPGYWFEHLRRAVRFGDGIAQLARDPRRVLLEVGPGHTLGQLARQHPARQSTQIVAHTLASDAGQGEHHALLSAAGRLWTAGVDLHWDAVQSGESRRRVSLPTYPFEKKLHWPTVSAAEPAPVAESETVSLPSERAMTAMTRSNDRKERIRREMVRVLHELSGMDQDQFADDKSFLELGFDSLFLGQASLAFQKTFGVRVRFREFFETAPTPGDMVRLLDERMPADKFADAPAPAAAAQPAVAAPAATAVASVAPEASFVTAPAQASATAAAPFASAPLASPPLVSAALATAPSIALPAPTALIAPGADASLIERIVAQQLQVVLEVTRQQLATLGQAASAGAVAATATPAAPHASPVAAPAHVPAQASASPATASAAASSASAAAKPAADAKTTPMKVFAQAIVNDPSGITWQPLERAPGGGPTPRQQRAIDELIASYCAKTARSKALTQEMRPYLADPRAIVGFAPVWKETTYQICSERSQGGRMWDVDGNEWLDVTLGFGASAYGHSPAFVVDAIKAQLDKGMELGTQSQLSADVGRLFCELTGHERVCFCTAGTEAVMGALRLARAYTGRDRFAMFNGDTHGRLDEVLGRPVVVNNEYSALPAAAGIAPHSVKPTLFLEFGNPKSLEVIEHYADELAAVLVEPIRTRSPDLQPIEFLHAMRALTRKHGIIFIMDEVVTGFRVHQGGAQRLLGIEPDLSTWGKAVAGGMPIGVISGKAEYMDALDGGFWQFGDDSVPEARMTNFGGAGTFSRHPLSMAAAWATLSHVKSEGPDLQERTSRKAERFVTTLNAKFRRERLPIHIERFRTFWAPRVLGDRKFEPLLFVYLRNEGIHIYVDYPCYICTAHTDAEVDELIAGFTRAVEKMHAAGLLPEPPPDAPPTGGGTPRERESASPRERAPEPAVTLGHRSLMGPSARHATGPPAGASAGGPARAASFSMYFFGNSPAEYAPDKYDLIVEAARFADAHGFSAVMFPERHFHPVGGFSPNPVLLAAALALETKQIQLRGASVVLPLHEPIRVAEEWSVVDNLSGGRVGISIASGWHPNDFVFHPDRYERRRELCVEGLRTIRTLWRGDALPVVGGTGNALSVRLHPQPKQSELPVWFTCSQGSSYEHAGALGVHVLGMLTNQSLDEVAGRIAQYRAARAAHGFDPESGRVTMLVHTFVGPDADIARRVARGPMREYLRSYLDNSQKRHDAQGHDTGLEADDIEFLLDRAFEDYVKEKAFLGSPDSCVAVAERLAGLGIDEFACFVDFGVDPHTVRANLRYIAELKTAYEARAAAALDAHESGATRDDGATRQRDAIRADLATREDASADNLPPLPGERGQGVRGGRRDDGIPVRQLPLTPGQTEIWLASRLGDDSANAFHQSASIALTGPLDTSALQRALRQLIARHEALRITIAPDGDAQIIHPTLDVAIAEIALDSAAPASVEQTLSAIVARDLATPFNLVDGPLLRVTAVRLAPDRYQLILSACHIICDGWSLGIMLRDLSTLYSAAVEGTRPELPAVMPFAEYLAWREQPEQREEETRAEEYWLAQFPGVVPVLDLPGDRPRPRFKTYNGSSQALLLDAAYLGTLRRAATKRGLTVFSAAVGAYATLLHRLSGQDDLVIGLAAAGQPTAGHDDLVGHCVSLLPYRVRLTGETPFGAQLAAVRSGLLDAFDHQACTYGSLIGRIKTPRDTSRLPLVSTVVTHELDTPGVRFAGLDHRIVWNPKQHCNFDLELYLTESAADGLRATLCYNTDLFDASTVARWLDHLHVLLDAFIDGAASNQLDTPVGALPLLTAAERTRMLETWNATEVAYPRDEQLHTLVAAQAARTPRAPALTFEAETLTYAELDRRASALAAHLRTLGVGENTLVGIAVERSIEMVVGLLGILKAGGAYVPIDPTYPADRLAFMLEDADVPVLLTQQRLRAALPATRARVIELDRPLPSAPGGETGGASGVATPATIGSAESLAYMIYTSGSTGRPKGALNAHRGIVNRLLWMQDAYRLTAQDTVLQKTPFSFDVSVWEFFWPLITGARLVIARPGGHQDPEYLAQLIARERISILHFVPSMLRAFLDGASADDCRTLRDVICSGEALPGDLVEAFFRTLPATRLHNLYGPTEAAVDVTAWECPRDFRGTVVPIGRPIANTRCYILDARQEPAPIGLPGELHLGGVQVGRGYHQRPELTAERFIRDPFSTDPHARLYRTGDLCRYLADGTIEFLGRIDHQVKIRGFRIELGEIEAAIAEHPAIAQAVVMAREDAPGEKRLVAYLVARDAQAGESAPADLPAFLAARLPNYMVPSAFIMLPALPLSPNGKVDRKALPAPERGAASTAASYAAPRTAREQELADIWTSVLRLERVGLDDNFFEIGGDSILAIQIATRARRAGWTIAPRQFFQYQTVRELTAVAMPIAPAAESAPDARAEVTGRVTLSPIQRWFLEQDVADAHHWNQSLLLEIADVGADAGAPIDPRTLEAALNDVVRHHDALRLRFTKQGDTWTQEYAALDTAVAAAVNGAPAVSLLVDKIAGLSADEQQARLLETTLRAQGSLDLARPRLVAAAYFDRGAASTGLLFLAVHHLAIDGVSWRILLEDLELAYRQRRAGDEVVLPAKSWSFQRWVERLAAQADAETVAASAGHWSALPARVASPLPPDAPEAATTEDVEASTATVVVTLPADRTADLLQRVSPVYNTQINDVLLAALLLGFHRRTGTDALLLHLEGHGREDLAPEDAGDDADVSRTVGWFTSLFPVDLRLDGLSDPGALLKHVKEQLRQTPQRGLGYGLLRYLASAPETRAAVAAHAEPSVAFNYFGQIDGWLADSTLFRRSDLRTAPDHGPRARRLLPIEVNARVLAGQLEFHWSFGRNRHRHETIEALASATLQALQDLVTHCLSPQAGGVTPSDFPSANLSQEALDDLLAELGESSS